MSVETQAMMGAGIVALAAGIYFVRPRFAAATGAGKLLVWGPVFNAVALAIFAAEHFTAAHDLAGIVPRWLPGPLFWTYFAGVALLAAAISFIAWRYVRLSASLLALFFLIIVAIVDLPNLPKNVHDRIFWTLTVRETCFAAGALVLAGSLWPRGKALISVARTVVALTFLFYAIEHFIFPRNVTGVPLEKLTPQWIPGAAVLAYLVGIVLFACGLGLMARCSYRIAAATAGTMLFLLTLFFYLPILISEIHTPLAVEGINYVGDTLLFAGTALLAGFGGGDPA